MDVADRAIAEIERLSGQDVQRRNIAPLAAFTRGNLARAAASIARHPSPSIAIITGFYLGHGEPPNCETDGPPGAAMLAVVSALQMVCETGDNVVIVSPIWPNIFQATRVVGAEPRLVRLDEAWQAGRWRLDLDRLFDACDGRTKAMFLASPSNPTGWTLTASEQKTILDFCRARGIAILADEVYGTLIYDGGNHAPSFLTIADEDDAVFAINSFSKPWAMTGWRIGWLVHPKSVEPAAAAMAQCNNTGSTHFVQYGALAALSPQGDAFRGELLERCRKGREVVQD